LAFQRFLGGVVFMTNYDKDKKEKQIKKVKTGMNRPIKNIHDFIGKASLADNNEQPTMESLGLVSLDPSLDGYILSSNLRNECINVNPNSRHMDLLAELKPIDMDNPPPNYNPNERHLLLVEFEEERKAEDPAKYLRYLASILNSFNTSKDINVRLHFFIIYSPKENSSKNPPSFEFSLPWITVKVIYLDQTGVDELLDLFAENLEAGEKARYLDLIRLVYCPMIKEKTPAKPIFPRKQPAKA
jgi:hypothetical protein